MLFNSLEFIVLFLPTVWLAAAVCRGSFRYWLLIAASLLFYGQSGEEHAAALAVSIVWVYFFGDVFPKYIPRSISLAAAILGPLCALIYYKYLGFLIGDVAGLFRTGPREEGFSLFLDVALPAGISFYTFQLISYALDRYSGVVKEPIGLRNLLLYVTFFPQLIAGPIVRYTQIRDDLVAFGRKAFELPMIVQGIGIFGLGLAFKVLIADSLSHFLAPLIADSENIDFAGFASLLYGYSFQIYFDFYGYSLCAIGLALMFAIRLPHNFDRPYAARNPQEFWRRWHITLSYWIRDYVYLSLGGNRNYVRNIAIVFVICGIWHGAGFSFILWGAYHAVLVIFYHYSKSYWDRLPTLAQITLNFNLVSVGWLLFLFDLEGCVTLIAAQLDDVAGNTSTDLNLLIVTAVAAVIAFAGRAELSLSAYLEKEGRFIGSALLGASIAVLLLASLLFIDRSESFIYFRF